MSTTALVTVPGGLPPPQDVPQVSLPTGATITDAKTTANTGIPGYQKIYIHNVAPKDDKKSSGDSKNEGLLYKDYYFMSQILVHWKAHSLVGPAYSFAAVVGFCKALWNYSEIGAPKSIFEDKKAIEFGKLSAGSMILHTASDFALIHFSERLQISPFVAAYKGYTLGKFLGDKLVKEINW